MDVFIMDAKEYAWHLQNTLEMPNFTSWDYSREHGLTCYRYLGGCLQMRLDGEWYICSPCQERKEPCT